MPEEAAATASAPAEEPPAEEKEAAESDILRWPDEEPPPPELWDLIERKHEWEEEERGYIFEERLAGAERHKALGNEHFRQKEWELALRRYKRALHSCHMDEMQMADLLDSHKEQVHGIQVPCKLNLAACTVAICESELQAEQQAEHADRASGEKAAGASTAPAQSNWRLPDGSLDLAVRAVNEVLGIKGREPDPKAHFRKGQLLMLQGDLPGAKEEMRMARKFGATSAALRDSMLKLKALEVAERARERALYGGKLQPVSHHKLQEEGAARHAKLRRWLCFLLLPVVVAVAAASIGFGDRLRLTAPGF